MSDREIIKEYSNGELTVIWKPKTCIHAAECVKRLPEVYKPNEKPWVQIENASTEELIDQIKACPSGALDYKISGVQQEVVSTEDTKVEIMQNGPLLVHGDLNIYRPDGSTESKSRTTAFCRCGASSNKPYCDGAHNNSGFIG